MIMLQALRLIGFQDVAQLIQQKWSEFLSQISVSPEPEYHRCYPDNLIEELAKCALEAIKQSQSRIATSTTQDSIHLLLNQAWEEFWQNPSTYVNWEKKKIEALLTGCEPQ